MSIPLNFFNHRRRSGTAHCGSPGLRQAGGADAVQGEEDEEEPEGGGEGGLQLPPGGRPQVHSTPAERDQSQYDVVTTAPH